MTFFELHNVDREEFLCNLLLNVSRCAARAEREIGYTLTRFLDTGPARGGASIIAFVARPVELEERGGFLSTPLVATRSSQLDAYDTATDIQDRGSGSAAATFSKKKKKLLGGAISSLSRKNNK